MLAQFMGNFFAVLSQVYQQEQPPRLLSTCDPVCYNDPECVLVLQVCRALDKSAPQ